MAKAAVIHPQSLPTTHSRIAGRRAWAPVAVARGAGTAASRAALPAQESPAARQASAWLPTRIAVGGGAEPTSVPTASSSSRTPLHRVVQVHRGERLPPQRANTSRALAPEQPEVLAKATTAPLQEQISLAEREASQVATLPRRRTSVVEPVGAASHLCKLVSVIAPGGGTNANRSVYAELARSALLSVEIVGRARAEYDRYPEKFKGGKPAPNLESFAMDLLSQGTIAGTDCLVVGSRGGQVVLPTLWDKLGALAPPAVVINGGCAMKLPEAICWPDEAVTFLVMGGRDNFRSKFSDEGYFADARARVPAGNATTAILYVREMEHMPQSPLLLATLQPAVRALMMWKESGRAPAEDFHLIMASLAAGGFNGWLAHTVGRGEWKDFEFGSCEASHQPTSDRATSTLGGA